MTRPFTTDHERSAAVELAAQWLADQAGGIVRPIPALQERFGLSALQATEACAMAARMRTYRSAHG
ncbi:hypothetical protein [Rhizobium alvei]|uniref:Uncharacterized protein n=1 Tax=Rhizobium alvei TaxID=1132659 RepID=A0ABT8YKC6_9HYPH|nr:hypothetical protein [Rhizobium alvei]MDO6963981.1 hypothetical protein [Rhizobium alvei]